MYVEVRGSLKKTIQFAVVLRKSCENTAYSLVPNVTHRSIETDACRLGESIGLNYPHA